jgi:hypothetical protein
MNTENNIFENIGLSLKQEEEKEKEYCAQLTFANSPEEANRVIEDYKDLAENSLHGRTSEMINNCLDTVDYRCSGGNIGNTIVIGAIKDLFPVLYKNIGLEKEIVSVKQLQDLTQCVNRKMYNESLHDISKIELAKSLFKLCALINGKAEKS